MRVRTVRKHVNRHGVNPTKKINRKYTVAKTEGGRLIAIGVVVEDGPHEDARKTDRPQGSSADDTTDS